MKRCLSVALILALFVATINIPALAEESELINEFVDTPAAPAQSEGGEALTAEPEQTVPDTVTNEAEGAEAADAAPAAYVRVTTEGAVLTSDAGGLEPLAALGAGSVALALEAGALTRVALYTERGIVEGYVAAECLVPMDDGQIAAYMDAIAENAVVALYRDSLDTPLSLSACDFADAPTAAEPAPMEDALTAGEPAPMEDAPTAGEPAPMEDAPTTGEAAPMEDAPTTGEAAPMEDEAGDCAEGLPQDLDAEGETAIMAGEGFVEEVTPVEEAAQAPGTATGLLLSADALTMGVKETYTGLTAAALPEGSQLPAVTWRSGNAKIVKVDAETGKLTGVKKGSAYVYASFDDGEEVACKVTVKAAPGKITLKTTALTISTGMTFQLSGSFPKGTASATLTCTSSDEKVATVDGTGLITAVGAGKATITVKTFNNKKAKCKLTVVPEPAAVVFPSASVSLGQTQKVALNAEALSADGEVTPATITYSIDPNSQDAGCIKLDAATGEVTGVRKGQAVVLAATNNGMLATCAVVVAAAPKAISLSASALTIGVKETYAGLKAEVTPPDGESECATAVTWSSSSAKVVKVDPATGELYGVKDGSATITAKTVNGLSKKCKVTVKKAPSKISSLSPAEGKLQVGQTAQYKVGLPSGTGGGVSFSSSNTAVATISETGVVTAVGVGSATITATTYNGKSKTAKLTVENVSGESGDNTGEDFAKPEDKASDAATEKLQYVISVARSKLGKLYVYGAFGPNTFDCSGFTNYCFRQIDVDLKQSAYTQGYDKKYPKIAFKDLRAGDLVFFDTVTDSDLSDHVGIFLGKGKFIHASSSAGKVIISGMSSGYYNRVFSWGRRVMS